MDTFLRNKLRDVKMRARDGDYDAIDRLALFAELSLIEQPDVPTERIFETLFVQPKFDDYVPRCGDWVYFHGFQELVQVAFSESQTVRAGAFYSVMAYTEDGAELSAWNHTVPVVFVATDQEHFEAVKSWYQGSLTPERDRVLQAYPEIAVELETRVYS